MREQFQKLARIVVAFALVAVSVFACLERAGLWRAEAQATRELKTLESVETSLAFATTYHYGEIRHFEGDGVGVSMTCEASGGEAAEETFTVELHRMVLGIVDVPVGSAVVPREGSAYITWDNTGSGDFFLRFVKAPDGQVVASDDVRIFSFEASE